MAEPHGRLAQGHHGDILSSVKPDDRNLRRTHPRDSAEVVVSITSITHSIDCLSTRMLEAIESIREDKSEEKSQLIDEISVSEISLILFTYQ